MTEIPRGVPGNALPGGFPVTQELIVDTNPLLVVDAANIAPPDREAVAQVPAVGYRERQADHSDPAALQAMQRLRSANLGEHIAFYRGPMPTDPERRELWLRNQ
jgi:hypothetical protein